MVRPSSFRSSPGCVAIGFAIDGTGLFLHLIQYLFDHVARAERKTAVHQYRAQLFFRHAGFKRQQRTQLRVAILFDDETELALFEESLHRLVERESTHPEKVRGDAARGQDVDRLPHRRIAAAKSDDAELR